MKRARFTASLVTGTGERRQGTHALTEVLLDLALIVDAELAKALELRRVRDVSRILGGLSRRSSSLIAACHDEFQGHGESIAFDNQTKRQME